MSRSGRKSRWSEWRAGATGVFSSRDGKSAIAKEGRDDEPHLVYLFDARTFVYLNAHN